MIDIQNDFLNKANYIIEDKNKLNELKLITNDLILKCIESIDVEEATLILDENLNITDSDDIFNKWFNLGKDYLLGKNIKEFFSKELQDVIIVFFEKLKKKKFHQQKNLIIKINNIEEMVNIEGKIFRFNDKNCIILSFTKKIIESNIYKLKKIEEETANLVVRIKDFNTVMKEVLKIFVNSGLFDLGWVAKIDKDLKRVIPIITLNEEKEDIEFKKQVFDYNYFQEILDLLINKEEVIADNIEFKGKKYRKAVIFPVFNKWEYGKDNDIEYAVLVYSEKNINFNDEELILLKEIIYKLNIAIADIFIKEQTNILLSTDTLTNLPKREIFIKEIERLIKEDVSFAVAIVDINKLKKVNSVLGFWAGDKAIKKIADYLKNNLEKSFVSRIGGDEFGVIIKGEKSEIFKMLDKILAFNNEIVKINGSGVYLSLSVGVSFFPDDSKTKENLIIKAERALSITKKKGGIGISYANENLTILPKDYLDLEKELKEAIENNEYEMYYQPIVDVDKNIIWGAEALLRWNSKKRGLVSPGRFIPILEESGLINEVGDVIIEKVLKDIKEFENKDINFIISMNVSGIQLLSQNIALKLLDRIKELNIKKDKIIVEITESVLMENIDFILPQIELLKKEGIKIEIDDFGTGYSSLAYLKKLPISALKIDMTFVKDILKDEEDEQIVKAIISMAKSLNKKTIAEGAETKEIVDELKKLGVDYIQGYYFAKPMPKEKLKNFLENFIKNKRG
ncbi:conserved hypothetical protein [Lebetimonas natsushimae]|uniref:Uncharacterized protein n=1 Tax=Lebetimonas natsushimae TaxID=1936991 RepID=A0A292YFT1_9BACT|nr:bifunctional diguanylate cyclase/phosphodiesterase [Lebetimonas natsushimae]GAX88248.1 conserved hypothetical protein [Lebetimonas natsushimae]